MRIGFAWSGATMHRHNHRRSIPLTMWEDAIFRRFPKQPFVCLNGQTTDDENTLLEQYDNVAPPPGQMADFYDTMLYLRDIDLVISVDTALAHLAGCEGIPTWLLIAAAPDWRWMAKGDATHWYPQTELIRQPKLGDWESVLEAVGNRIEDMAIGYANA